MSHTYALLEVSSESFAEIRKKLEAAGYDVQFDEHDGQQRAIKQLNWNPTHRNNSSNT